MYKIYKSSERARRASEENGDLTASCRKESGPRFFFFFFTTAYFWWPPNSYARDTSDALHAHISARAYAHFFARALARANVGVRAYIMHETKSRPKEGIAHSPASPLARSHKYTRPPSSRRYTPPSLVVDYSVDSRI